MNKKVISHDVQLVVAILDDTDPMTIDFKSLDDAMNAANFHKSMGDHVWWIDESVAYDDGSVFHLRYDV